MGKLSKFAILTLAAVLMYTIIVSMLESLVIYYHVNFVSKYHMDEQGNGISEADLIYHSIFLFSLLFQVLLVVDSLWRHNTIQAVVQVIFNLLSLVYAGIQLYQHKILEDNMPDVDYVPSHQFPRPSDAKTYFESKMRPIEYVIIGIVTTFSVIFAMLSYQLTHEFGWENYKKYSADLKIRKAYVALTILQSLIKVDTFFVVSYAAQLIPSEQIGYSNSLTETVLIFLMGTIILSIAWYAVLAEQKYAMLIVINLLSLSEVYMVYRVININVEHRIPDPYEFTRRFLTFFLVTTAALVAITIFYALICFRNMTKGIYVLTVYGVDTEVDTDEVNNEAIDIGGELPGIKKNKRESKRMSQIQQNRKSQALGRRMSID